MTHLRVCDHPARVGALSMCGACWQRLPLELRQRWWDDTGYGDREPSPEIVMEVRAAVAGSKGGGREAPAAGAPGADNHGIQEPKP